MSNDGQDDKNVNNEQTQLNDNNSSNNQDQKENTSTNHDTLTPEAVIASVIKVLTKRKYHVIVSKY